MNRRVAHLFQAFQCIFMIAQMARDRYPHRMATTGSYFKSMMIIWSYLYNHSNSYIWSLFVLLLGVWIWSRYQRPCWYALSNSRDDVQLENQVNTCIDDFHSWIFTRVQWIYPLSSFDFLSRLLSIVALFFKKILFQSIN